MRTRLFTPHLERALALLLCLLSACSQNPAPVGWTPTAEEAGRDTYGGWVQIRLSQPLEGVGPAQEATVTSSTALLFADPDLSARRTGELPAGCRVAVLETNGPFHRVVSATGESGWLFYVNLLLDDPRKKLQGELLAVDADTLYLVGLGGVVPVPTAKISEASMFRYYNHWGRAAMWSVIGTMGTASHGLLFLLSFPTWVLVGTAVTSGASREARIQYPRKLLDDFRPYARFPQGMPHNLSREQIRQKIPS